MPQHPNTDTPPDGPGTELAITDKRLIAQFAQMATMLPMETEGDMSVIFERIINATRWEDLDAPWESSKAEQLIGRKLILRGAKRRPSDFRESLGFYLVMDCVDEATGEPVVVVNGSVSVVAQTVRAYALGALPLLVEFIVAERPTQRGFRPHHMKVWGHLATPAQHGHERG